MTPDSTPIPIETQAPSTAGMTTKVVKGSIWTLAGQVLPLGVSLIATPFVIRFLGVEQYGVLALINLMLSYLTFADFGMGLASTNFASEAYAKASPDQEAKVIRLSALIGLSTSTLSATVVILLANVIVDDLLKIPAYLHDTVIVAIYLSCVIFVARVLSGILNAPQLVRLRMDLNSSINAVFNIIQIVAVPIVIFLGGGIIGAVLTIMCAALATLITHIVVSGSLLRRLFEFSFEWSILKPLLRFGGSIFIALVAMVLLGNLEKVVLTRYTSVTTFAYYAVAFTLANMVTLFSASLAQSLIPAFSQLYSMEKHSELQALYARTIRLNLVIFAPAAMVLCLIARPFFTVWAGDDFGRESTYPFYVLIIGLFFNFSASVAGTLMVATRKTKASAILYWAELFPYLILVGFLTYNWGAVGAALAWSVRLLFDAVALSFLVRRMIGVSPSLFNKETAFLVAAVLILILGIVIPNLFVGKYELTIASGIASLTAYAILVWAKALTSEERNSLAGVISRLSSRYVSL